MDVQVVGHPLVAARLAVLRDGHTESASFRRALREIASMLVYEATRDLPTVPIPIVTPVTEADGVRLAKPPLLVPVLRA